MLVPADNKFLRVISPKSNDVSNYLNKKIFKTPYFSKIRSKRISPSTPLRSHQMRRRTGNDQEMTPPVDLHTDTQTPSHTHGTDAHMHTILSASLEDVLGIRW